MLSSCSPSYCFVQLLRGRLLALVGCLPWSISAFTRGERSCLWKLFSGWFKKKKKKNKPGILRVRRWHCGLCIGQKSPSLHIQKALLSPNLVFNSLPLTKAFADGQQRALQTKPSFCSSLGKLALQGRMGGWGVGRGRSTSCDNHGPTTPCPREQSLA